MVTPVSLFKEEPSLHDQRTEMHYADGRREYVYPDGDVGLRAAAEAYAEAYKLRDAEVAGVEAIAARVKAIISAGPPPGMNGDALDLRLDWLATSRRQLEAAEERRSLTADAASRHAAAVAELAQLRGEVRLAHKVWADTQSADAVPPDGRLAEIEHQERIISASEPLSTVADDPDCYTSAREFFPTQLTGILLFILLFIGVLLIAAVAAGQFDLHQISEVELDKLIRSRRLTTMLGNAAVLL